ncbi:MAG TPA: hypothetical protein VNC50_21060 [Planctomycetia bacterium]|nr:hypothetical protein [Planctomycetia bacterium]
MFKMMKRLTLAAGLLAAGGFLVWGTSVGAYGRAMVGWAKQSVSGQVPIELEIRAAREMLKDIDKKVENAVRVVAREEVEINGLKDHYASMDKELATKKESIVKSRDAFETRLAKADPLKRDLEKQRLATLFASYEKTEAMQKVKGREILAREKGLLASNMKVENLRKARFELKGKVDELDARRKLAEAEKIVAKVEIDESEISDLKNLVGKIQSRLEEDEIVQHRLGEMGEGFAGEPAVPAADVLKKVEEKFGKPNTTAKGTSL